MNLAVYLTFAANFHYDKMDNSRLIYDAGNRRLLTQ